jgi:Protein of unknown function (DUF3253)/Uncharacterized protein conserved in bacteria (DUF2256)
MTWRKAWARTWDTVRYCSDACRRGRREAPIAALEQAIVTLLDDRAATASICPSEAARLVAPANWEALMEPARAAARRLAAAGRIQITQQGRVVDPASIRGPVRLRRTR